MIRYSNLLVVIVTCQLISTVRSSVINTKAAVSHNVSESFIIPDGDGSPNELWSDWGAPSNCSRPCGGGVAYQERECLDTDNGRPSCTGGTKKYFSCNFQDCPEQQQDFRKQQCSEFNDVPFEGHRYQWEPYTRAQNPCELNCMPIGEQFYYRHRSKVIDGTRCNDESFDVCIDGTCQPVGCDLVLGSQAKEDKCRVCRGDGSSCKTVSGVLDQTNLEVGYNDLLPIPTGSTNVVINERAPSNNYLAIRNLTGFYYLNGNYRLDIPRTISFAGCNWHYERRLQGVAAPDRLTCLGPTTESVYLVLLTQDRNVSVQYEYSVSSASASVNEPDSYSWMITEFQPCTVSCGGGVQSRNVKCNSKNSLRKVDEGLCNANEKPATTQKCGQQACLPCRSTWNTIRILLDDKTLHIGYNNMLLIPNGAVNVTIIATVPTRHYLAVRNETGYFHLNGNRMIDSSQTIPFAGCNWHYEKGPVSSGAPDRLTCQGPTKDSVYLAMIMRDKNASIQYEYSVLSATESVDGSCSLPETCKDTKYGCCPDGLSPATGPKDEGCPSESDCADTLFGCCPDKQTPAEGNDHEGCSIETTTVVGCIISQFGCCDDGISEAKGSKSKGCPGVADEEEPSANETTTEPVLAEEDGASSEHGCCPDNTTEATGLNGEGCEPCSTEHCQYTEHGCCPDQETEAKGPNYEGCPCHAYLFGCCPNGVTPANGPNNEGCHCSNSEFKCCSDGQTAAKGTDGEGCTCAESKYGCCPDGSTEAQGTKFEGCTDVPESPQKACGLPKDKGTCSNYVIKHFFDVEYGGCGQFWYGGCDGNNNRFDSADDCKAVCETPTGKDVCHLPKITGACKQHTNMWYYDTERNLCSQFTYNGCLGNANRFEKLEDCMALCSVNESEPPCEQPKEDGPCNGTFERWYYDKETGACQLFYYGGCKGNKNNYQSEAACNYHCKKPGVHKHQRSCGVPVIPPPILLEKVPCEKLDIKTEEGGVATLRCFAPGYPSPFIRWRKGAVMLNTNQGRYVLTPTGDLQIVQVNRTDSGTYTCIADNGVSEPVLREVQLTVNDPIPRDAYIAGNSNDSQVVQLEGPASLRCAAGGYPLPVVSWWRGTFMMPLNMMKRDYSLNFASVRLQDLGPYMCQAYPAAGTAISRTVTLLAYGPVNPTSPVDDKYLKYVVSDTPPEVDFPPTTTPFDIRQPVPVTVTMHFLGSNDIDRDSNFTINCTVDGYPKPMVSWLKNGQIIMPTERIHITDENLLLVTGAVPSDSGLYKCLARNEYSEAFQEQRLRVQGINVPQECTDNALLVKCNLIVAGHLCNHKYYKKFCCRSCTLAGQINVDKDWT
ncbi:papilin-like isoform X2 [Anopheles albimanus]|uniref:papilin-like isoform X2 n=1 Tax=Anopheles albimanus TaxID=7167 RepID=UPI00163E5E95|nr:papilin-like isoform X2 [Anopheles albimanus]